MVKTYRLGKNGKTNNDNFGKLTYITAWNKSVTEQTNRRIQKRFGRKLIMAKQEAQNDYYIKKGLKNRKSDKREDSEAGRLASYIIDRIPKDFKVYEDHDINEEHLAEAVVSTCGRLIKYCPQIGWMVYRGDEGRWTERYAESAVQRVIIHFGQLLWEGTDETHPEEMRFARHILSSGGINAIKSIMRHNTLIAIEQEAFDADNETINCRGDRYNFRTAEVRESVPEDFFSKSTFCRAAVLKKIIGGGWEMPKISRGFEDFMVKTTSRDGANRADLAFWILFYLGYCLTGDNGASFFVNFHGQGKNGKSVLLNLMTGLLGDYAAPISKDLVIENRFAGQFDLASLPGVRFAVLIDAPEGRLNMDVLKPLITGDPVNGKRKFLKDFVFNPVCKIAVGSNPRLTLKDTGMAVRRRVRMVPFDYIVPDEETIVSLHKKLLKEEAEEILALLIWFAHEYYKRGEGPKAFPQCKVVDEASREYMDSEDLVGRWMTERTEKAEKNLESSASLYEDFRKWAGEEGVRKVMSRNKFGEHLSLKLQKKRTNEEVFYINIKLKNRPSSPPLPSG
jgi:P4 family phage/plasmid primase-like protien